MKKPQINIILIIVFFLTSLTLFTVNAEAPFKISVEPKKANAKPGDIMTYSIRIDADAGFEEIIYLELVITALNYEEYYPINPQEPPYPKVFEIEIPVPEDVPADVTAHGVLRGYSGEHEYTEEVTLKISSGGIIGSIVGWILGVLNSIRNFISNLF
jgi:hypothetical protein